MEEEWRDKAFVKTRWSLRDEDLVGIIFKRILIPYWKRPDGVYMPLSYEISSSEEECAYHRWMNIWCQSDDNKRAITEAEISNELKTDYIWFKQHDIEKTESEGKNVPFFAKKTKINKNKI